MENDCLTVPANVINVSLVNRFQAHRQSKCGKRTHYLVARKLGNQELNFFDSGKLNAEKWLFSLTSVILLSSNFIDDCNQLHSKVISELLPLPPPEDIRNLK